MSNSESPSPVLFFDTLTAYQDTAALKAALDLELFTAIGQSGATAAELATKCRAAERGMRILADYLVILGFLVKNGDRYSLTRDSTTFLDKKSPAYAGGAAAFLLSPTIRNAFDELATAARQGSTALSEEGTMAPDHPVWIDFARGMAPMMIPPAQALAALLPLDASRPARILDIAAGHGIYGIAVAQKYPLAQLVALDWSPVLEVARENAKAAGLAERFSTIAGSAFQVDLGENYDVVLVPNFLHHFDPPTCITFLQKAHGALRTGGCVCHRRICSESRPGDPAGIGRVQPRHAGQHRGGRRLHFRRVQRDAGPGWIQAGAATCFAAFGRDGRHRRQVEARRQGRRVFGIAVSPRAR